MTLIEQFSSFYTDLASMKIEALKDIYSDDVTFIDPIASHQGLPAVEGYFSKLLKNAKFCEFDIHETLAAGDRAYVVNWTMRFTSRRINKGRPVSVDGISKLTLENNKIVFHRDYYDLGQMVYEHVPLLGRIIKKIKRGMV
jgi:ketosteroid isomerase-like protein